MLQHKKVDPTSITSVLREKWSTDVLIEGYVPFPKRLLRSLSSLFVGADAMGQLAVVLSIIDYRRPNLTRGPSLEYLAFNAGMEMNEFRRHLDRLKQLAWVKVTGPEESMTIEIDGLLEAIKKVTPDK